MSKRSRILLAICGSFAGLILLLFISALMIVHTDRFRTFVRDKIIATIKSRNILFFIFYME